MKRLVNKEKGQSIVEMALVLPILILLLLCIMEGGRIFAGYVEMESSARDATRYASINTTKTSDDVKAYLKSRLTMLDSTKLDGTNSDGSAPFAFSRITTGSGSNVEHQVTVTVKYSLDIITPIIRDIIGDPFYIQVSMSMRSE